MKRKLCGLLVLLILGAFAVWLEPTRVPWGWLRGEAFYDGRPTSWWASEAVCWDEILFDRVTGISNPVSVVRTRHRVWNWLPDWVNKPQVSRFRPSLLQGDVAAEPVLRALTEHPDEKVRDLAWFGLHQIELKQVEPEAP